MRRMRRMNSSLPTNASQFRRRSAPFEIIKDLTPDVFAELDRIYQPSHNPVSDQLYDSVERWIKHHEVSHA